MKYQASFIKENLQLGNIDWEFDPEFAENGKLDIYSTSNWTAESEDQYEEFESKINQYNIDNELFSLLAWCDISGYDYWVVQQEEANYVSIDVMIKKETLTLEEIKQIEAAIFEANDYFESELLQIY